MDKVNAVCLRISGKLKAYPVIRFTDMAAYKRWSLYQPEPVYSYHGNFDKGKYEDIWIIEIGGIVPRNPYILRGGIENFF